MHDIKIPDGGKNPRSSKTAFDVMPLGSANQPDAAEGAQLQQAPGEKVKVKFEKFVQLVATHDFEGVMKHHADEDIILSTNLLTDLANAHEEQPNENKKLPIFLIVGIIIGVVLTYLIIRF